MAAAIISSVASPANYLLLIDTCGSSGMVALAALAPAPRVLAQVALPGRATSERLFPAIRSLFEDCRVALAHVAAVGIIHGPGSFTGIRVGLSAAKGLCESLNVPLVAVSRLALLAGNAPSCDVLALLDAGRGEFYCGHYRAGNCLGEILVTRERIEALAGELPEAQIVACEEVVASTFPNRAKIVPEPAPADLLAETMRRFTASDFDDLAGIDANYVRRTDVEIFTRQIRSAAARP